MAGQSALPPKTTIQLQSQEWQGPLPPPDALARFDQIVPNGAERIFKMVELEQAARIESENAGFHASIRDTKRGQYLGAAISVIAICAAVYTAYLGVHWSIPCALVGVPILGIVRAIVSPNARDNSH